MNKLSHLLLISFMIFGFAHSNNLQAIDLTAESVKGTYHLGTPERGKNQVMIEIGQLAGKYVIAVAACKQCPPAVYNYAKEESQTLKHPVFTTSGLYLIYYDENSFILVQPDGVLGRKIWSKIGHANIYSKDQNKAKQFDREAVSSFAINLSEKIMQQDIGTMAHNQGTYHLAVPQSISGKTTSEVHVEFIDEPKKQINIKPCEKCSPTQYKQLADESAMIGVDVYVTSSSYYLFDLKDGILVYTFANASGLGKVLWSKHSKYNVYSNNKAYIRQLLTSKEKQATLDQTLAGYFKSIKDEKQRRALEAQAAKDANRELPKEGLEDSTLKQQALAAAKRWANGWNWKETIQDAYFTGHDWSITRNPLTGIITGKIISGIVTMTHPDGRCRFQIMSFRQDYDGSQYTNLHTAGIGPIYDLSCDKLD
jgi:hypothetical protein